MSQMELQTFLLSSKKSGMKLFCFLLINILLWPRIKLQFSLQSSIKINRCDNKTNRWDVKLYLWDDNNDFTFFENTLFFASIVLKKTACWKWKTPWKTPWKLEKSLKKVLSCGSGILRGRFHGIYRNSEAVVRRCSSK